MFGLIFGLIAFIWIQSIVCEEKILIAHHKNVAQGYFSPTIKNTGLENENNINLNTYSIIGNLNKDNNYEKYRDANNKYKFELVYVYGDNTADTAIWKQSSWLTAPIIDGFERINIPTDLTGVINGQFLGLGLSDRPETYLDGNGASHNYWYQSVGTINSWNGGIPAFRSVAAISMHLYIYTQDVELAHHLNIAHGYFSSQVKNTGLENENDVTKNTYSIIGNFNNAPYRNAPDGKYKFQLEYQYSDGSKDIAIWKQSSWITERFIVGFESIDVPINNLGSDAAFEGLALSDRVETYLDGNGYGHPFWFQAVGTNQAWTAGGGIPAFRTNGAISMKLIILKPDQVYVEPSDEILLARHGNIANGYFPTNFKNTGVINENNPTANLFSVIGNFNKNAYIDLDGLYKFKLVYNYADGTKDTAIWKQSSWITEPTIHGFISIDIPMVQTNVAEFTGLGLSNVPYAYLDGNGQSHQYWFQAICSTQVWNGGIPAFRMIGAVSMHLYIYKPNNEKLICKHGSTAEGYFSSNLKNTGLENENDPNANTYSVIGNINKYQFLGCDNKYTFRLVYGYPDNSIDTAVWKQSSWITETNIIGFEPINIPIDQTGAGINGVFGGLGLSNDPSTYLDGNAYNHQYWYQAVGVNTPWNNGIPAFRSYAATSMRLYVIIPRSEKLKELLADNQYYVANDAFNAKDDDNYSYNDNYNENENNLYDDKISIFSNNYDSNHVIYFIVSALVSSIFGYFCWNYYNNNIKHRNFELYQDIENQ